MRRYDSESSWIVALCIILAVVILITSCMTRIAAGQTRIARPGEQDQPYAAADGAAYPQQWRGDILVVLLYPNEGRARRAGVTYTSRQDGKRLEHQWTVRNTRSEADYLEQERLSNWSISAWVLVEKGKTFEKIDLEVRDGR